VQTVASKLHGTEVEVEILKTKEDCDHIQFLITQLSGPGKASRPEAAQVQTLSIGNLQQHLIKTLAEVRNFIDSTVHGYLRVCSLYQFQCSILAHTDLFLEDFQRRNQRLPSPRC
jgi:hypothetical protein